MNKMFTNRTKVIKFVCLRRESHKVLHIRNKSFTCFLHIENSGVDPVL